VTPPGAGSARDCAAGDFNGDGITDLAFVNFYIENPLNAPEGTDIKDIWVWPGSPDLSSKAETIQIDHVYPVRVYTGDFDENGLDDLVVPEISWDTNECFAMIFFRKGTGFVTEQGKFGPGMGYGPQDCYPLVLHDFDGDGHFDIDAEVPDLAMGDGSGSFYSLRRSSRPTRPAAHGLDLNCDKIPDAVDNVDVTRIWRGEGKALFTVAVKKFEGGIWSSG